IAYMTAMPGHPYKGPLPEPSGEVASLSASLRGHVVMLSDTIGERRVGRGQSLDLAKAYIVSVMEPVAGQVQRPVRFEDLGKDGSNAENVIFEIAGASPQLVVLGAHYDSAPGTPGANDNASGVAAALELAKRLATRPSSKTIRIVFFANEEPPY